MKWYKILILTPIVVIDTYINSEIFEHKKKILQNDSWKKNNIFKNLRFYRKIVN